MTKNVNRVPNRQWAGWSKKARVIFNRSYMFFLNNQVMLNHPKARKLSPLHWKIVAWNAAWIAADACDDTLPSEFVDVEA